MVNIGFLGRVASTGLFIYRLYHYNRLWYISMEKKGEASRCVTAKSAAGHVPAVTGFAKYVFSMRRMK
jgi:hypothetical protein